MYASLCTVWRVALATSITLLIERVVEVQFLKEAQTYSRDSSLVSKLMLGLLGSIAEFEGSLIRERQAEGIAKAKVAR